MGVLQHFYDLATLDPMLEILQMPTGKIDTRPSYLRWIDERRRRVTRISTGVEAAVALMFFTYGLTLAFSPSTEGEMSPVLSYINTVGAPIGYLMLLSGLLNLIIITFLERKLWTSLVRKATCIVSFGFWSMLFAWQVYVSITDPSRRFGPVLYFPIVVALIVAVLRGYEDWP